MLGKLRFSHGAVECKRRGMVIIIKSAAVRVDHLDQEYIIFISTEGQR